MGEPPGRPPAAGGFVSTRWSLVQAAGDTADPRGRDALAELCRTYWPAVFAFIRSRGEDVDAALDLTQGFFTRFLEKKDVKDASRPRGRFRTFLLACVKHYLANEWDRRRAQKRGGGVVAVSIDRAAAESIPPVQLADEETPETAFDRQWAITLLESVLARLQEEQRRAGSSDRFRALEPFLTGDGEGATYRQVAARLGISEGAVKVAVHRLRKRYGALLREEVAGTLGDPATLDDEIALLFRSIGP